MKISLDSSGIKRKCPNWCADLEDSYDDGASTSLSDSPISPLMFQDCMVSKRKRKYSYDDHLGFPYLHSAAAVTASPPRRKAISCRFNEFGIKKWCPKGSAHIDDSKLDHKVFSCNDGLSISLLDAPNSPFTQDCMNSRRQQIEKITDNTKGLPFLDPTPDVSVPCPRTRVISSDNSRRGLKRKVGCVESATQTGRKVKIESQYDMGSELGRGKFGVVRLCKNKATGEEMACKTLPKKGPESVHNEVQIMQHLSGHPNIVTLKAVFEDEDSIHLVMEICSGGRLVDSMRKNRSYSESQAAKTIRELVEVIKYCHEMGVVHRDIKPENILLASDGQLKLADFGLSVHAPKGRTLSGLVGSPAYVAPDVFSETYTEKVDVWAAGVLLHGLLVGMLPFQGESVETIFGKIKGYEQLDFQTEKWKSVSGPAKDLLSSMLSRDAEKRLSPEDVLCHPWIMFYTDPFIRLQTRTEKKLKSYVKSDQRQHLVKTASGDGLDGKQGTADLITNKKTLDNSIYDNFKRTLFLRAASCTQPSHPGQPDLLVKGHREYDLVDVLSAAISQLTICRPKPSRGPITAYIPPLGYAPHLHMALCKAC